MSQSAAEKELEYFRNTLRSYDDYARYHLSANHARRMGFLTLPKEQRAMLVKLGYRDKLDAVDEGIRRNGEFLDEIYKSGAEPFMDDLQHGGYEITDVQDDQLRPDSLTCQPAHINLPLSVHYSVPPDPTNNSAKPSASTSVAGATGMTPAATREQAARDVLQDKVRSTIRQFVRDWSEEGKPEREACYDPCIAALENHYGHIPPAERRKVKVLIPGAGLGRLALEVAGKATNLLRSVRIPDILPADILPPDADFSFVAGDWCEVYGGQTESGAWPPGDQVASDQQGQWGAVVTCFFIDTARNIINYLRIIKGLLKDDGVWINVGPLLWHFENIVDKERGEGSIELSLDEVKHLARDMGFELSNETMSKTTYTGDPDGMLKSEYTVAFWTATKVKAKTG
ncbi:hypothetical protein QFC21_005845 [Naganishia friedmannii]|uniref:Uncharacterized protein n=1 Tax=Naganishia friedmannii TaxID=89922 RepID=A0ACC2V5S0_9TREE|nr:hypothetical protein QFC21_005845 [Naganishia friedmannii]